MCLISLRIPYLKALFLVVFVGVSPLNFAQVDHWEAVVYEYDTWQITVPTSPVDPSWNTIGFDVGGWTSATGGFGYGDGDDNTVLPAGTLSVYQRIEFNVTDTAAIVAAALTIDYDDGFVAYLNGVEIARELMLGDGQPDFDQSASGLHEATIYGGVYPAQYTLSKSFLASVLLEGVNVLSVQTHNENVFSSDLTSRVYFHLALNNESTDYNPATDWFIAPLIFEVSNLPLVVINTVEEAPIIDEYKVAALMGIINQADGINALSDPYDEFYGEIGIEIRGSSSGTFPKKAFGLETRGPDSTNYNASIFDWPIDNDWILYAPYSDKSLIRNVLTYKLGSEMGEWAPRTKAVELFVNGEYLGVYIFMERIKQNPGRVNINKLNYEDTEGNELTGGYVVKIDKTTGGGEIAWTSPYLQAPPATGPVYFQMHDPGIDEMHPAQLDYIETYITDFEAALYGPDFTDPINGYAPFIDVNSFIDFMIVNEISKNVDGYRISTFMYKERLSEGGKLVAGPLWDFNLGWGNANYCNGGLTSGWEIYFNDVCGGDWALNNPFYWNRFVEDPAFTHALNCRWQELRMTTLNTDTILAFIDEMELYLEDAADRNFQRWPILGSYVWPNNFVGSTYAEEMDYLRSWMIDRLNWMDANMFGSCEDLGFQNEAHSNGVFIYPNPTESSATITFQRAIKNGKIEVSNQLGQLVYSNDLKDQISAVIELSSLASGLYLVNVYDQDLLIAHQKIIRN